MLYDGKGKKNYENKCKLNTRERKLETKIYKKKDKKIKQFMISEKLLFGNIVKNCIKVEENPDKQK